MPKYSYENGEYVMFYSSNGDVICRMDEVAIAFSVDEEDGIWTLHKHGREENVREWYDKVTKTYRGMGFDDLVAELVIVVGKFPVDELNRCVDTSGYVKAMCTKLGLVDNIMNRDKNNFSIHTEDDR